MKSREELVANVKRGAKLRPPSSPKPGAARRFPLPLSVPRRKLLNGEEITTRGTAADHAAAGNLSLSFFAPERRRPSFHLKKLETRREVARTEVAMVFFFHVDIKGKCSPTGGCLRQLDERETLTLHPTIESDPLIVHTVRSNKLSA